MPQAVIVGYVRSPFCPAGKGALKGTRPDDLAASVVRALVERTKINPADIEDLILGCAFPEGEQGLNMARLVALIASLPPSVAGVTVSRMCGSSMQAIHNAAAAIQAGAGQVFVCAGVESLSRVPVSGFNPMPNPSLAGKYPHAYAAMGLGAESVARKFNISRREQEVLSVLSQAKAAAAQNAGKLDAERVPIPLARCGIADKDGCIAPGVTTDDLAKMRPAFEAAGTVAEGTFAPSADGAAAVLVTSEDYANANGLSVLARIRSFAVSGCEPEWAGIGPVAASLKALRRAGIALKDVDIIELNETFASQAVACIRELDLDIAKLNIDGGAIAFGHPFGASGARIVGKAAALLKREGKTWALAAQCIGGGQGIATVLEAV